MSRDPTTERQRQDLTRMNDDHHDDADLFRGHLRISALKPVLRLSTTNRAPTGRKGASVPAEPIRGIVVIVVQAALVS